MDPLSKAKNILLIDDDLGIRFVLKKLIFRHFPSKEQNINIYSASEGMEGLGLIFCIPSDIIIIDITLPKYGNREIIDYLKSNANIAAEKQKVIIMYHKNMPEDLTGFSSVDKSKLNFFQLLVNEIEKRISNKKNDNLDLITRLGSKIMNISEHSTFEHKQVFESNSNLIIQKTASFSIWVVEQVVLSLLFLIFVLFVGLKDPDTNLEQKKLDNLKLRNRFAGTYLTTILIALFIGFTWFKPINAASYTWDGGGVTNNWSDCINWSTDVCPLVGDTVTFDATSTKDATINAGFAPTSISAININSGYTGTITLAKTFTINTTFIQADGTFTAANQSFTVTGGFGLSAGTFTASSGTTVFANTFTISGGTFNHNSGSISFRGSGATLSCNNTTFNSVNFLSLSGTKTINSDCSLPLGASPTISGTIILNGTLSGTGTLNLTNVTYNSGFVLSGFTGYSGTSVTESGATVDFSSYSTFTLTGALTITTGTVSLPATATVGSFVQSGGTFDAPTTNFIINGSLTITGTPTFNNNSGLISFNGSSGSLACNNTVFNLVTFTHSSGTLVVNSDCDLPLGTDPTMTNFGIIQLAGTFSGTGTLTRTVGGLYLSTGAVLNGFTGLVISNPGTLTVNGAIMDFSSYSPFTLNGFTQFAGDTIFPFDVVLAGSFSLSGGTFTAPGSTWVVNAFFSITGGTFNNNGGSITFAQQTSSISCNNVVFNQVYFTNVSPFVKTVNSDCSLPLGDNPNLPGPIILNGTLSGTNRVNFNAITFNSGSALSGFNDYRSTTTTISGGSINLSTYSLFTASTGGLIVSSGSLTLPPSATLVAGLTISGGTFTSSSTQLTLTGGLNISGSPTFNGNGGLINFSTGGVSLTCNNVTFSTVTFTHSSGIVTINNGCTIPLGLNPTLSGLGSITSDGILTGSGTFTRTTGLLTMNTNGNITGFSALDIAFFNENGATMNLSAMSPSNISSLTHSTGTVTYPATLTTTTFNQTGGTVIAPSGVWSVSSTFTINPALTFTHNSGTVRLTGNSSLMTCNSAVFNLVVIAANAGQNKTIGPSCTLPLGATPTMTGNVINNGVLSGTGTLADTGSFSNNGTLSGFSGLTTTINLTIGASTNLGTYSSVTVGGIFQMTGGTFTAPSGTMSVAGNFTHTSGTFTHNNGTVNLNGGSQTISGIATTFYNLTKTLVSASPATLTFPSGVTQTVANTLTLNGFNTSNRLSLRSSSNGVQWSINPQGTRTISNLDVRDSNNVNGTVIQAYQTGSIDSTNNTNWNFADTAPNTPTTLGPTQVVNGSVISNTTPTFTFNLSDPDVADTVKYTIQISTASDFSVIVTDYTSVLAAQGGATFTLGQSAGSGTYNVGSSGQTLSSGSYYWRVKATDIAAVDSTYAIANGGAVAFILDVTAPNAFTPVVIPASPTNDTTPSVTFSTTDNIGIDHYEVQVDGGSFTTQVSGYSLPTQSEGVHTVTVRAYDTAGNFTDGSAGFTIDTTSPNSFTPVISPTSPTNDVTPTVTFSTTDGVGIDHYEVQVDGGSFTTQTSGYTIPTLSDGAHTITVRAYDAAGNFKDGSAGVTIDTTPPAAFTPGLNVTSPTNNQTPTLTFSTTDNIGIDHYEVQVDGGSYTTQTSGYVLPTLAQGVHSINVAAYDTAGNSRIGNVGVTIDITGAAITFTAPTFISNSSITDTTFTVIDNYGILVASVNSIGGNINCTQTTSIRLDCTSIITTSGNLTVNSTDVAGNANSNSSNGYVIDSVAPAVSITAPTKNSSSTITDTTIHVTDNYAINAGAVMATGGAISCVQTTSSIVDCTVSISVSGDLNVNATDVAGNPGSASETGYVVGSTPSSPNPFSPSLNVDSVTRDRNPIITFTTTDTSGIDHYEVKIDDGSFVIATSPYQIPTLDEGFHTITVRAISNSSTYTDGTVNVTIDLTQPTPAVINLNIVSPSNNNNPTATFSSQDTNGIDHYNVKVDDGEFITSDSPYNLGTLTDGPHTITVRGFDTAGNSSDSTLSFIIDTTLPTGSITINNGATQTDKKKVTVNLTAEDTISGIDTMIVSEDPDFVEASPEPFSINKELILSDSIGLKTVYVKFFDKSGNSSIVYSYTINYIGEAIPVSNDVPVSSPSTSGTGKNNISDAITTLLSGITNFINNISNSTIGKAIDIAAPRGAVLASVLIGATAAITYPNMFIYGFFFIKNRKKYKKFGIVYDIGNKTPVPFAIVRIYNLNTNEFVVEAPTDLNGRYGFTLDQGRYKIVVEATNYKNYVEEILFESKEGSFGIDVPLSKTLNTANLINNIKDNLNSINKYIVYIGFVISIIALILNRNILNVFVVIVYLIQAIIILYFNKRIIREWGYVYKENNERVKGAFVRIYDPKSISQLEVSITDEKGRFSFDIPDGDYLMTADGIGYSMSFDGIDKSLIFEAPSKARFVKVKVVNKKPLNTIIKLNQ